MPPRPPLPLGRLFLVGVIAPSLFALMNYWLLLGLRNGTASAPATCMVFIAQVAAVGILVGRLIDWPVLRAFMVGWGWLFLNVQVQAAVLTSAYMPHQEEFAKLVPILGGAQIGLLLIWAMLGTQPHWAVRWPVSTLVALVLAILSGGWRGDLLATQTVVLAMLCGVLIWQGFRLFRPEGNPAIALGQGGAGLPRLQFGLRHVLIWTTSLAILLAVLRGFDLLSMRGVYFLRNANVREIAMTGSLTAIVLVISLWAALGAGNAWLRWPLGILGGLIVALASGFTHWITRSPAGRIPRMSYPTSAWDSFWRREEEHILWLGLAGALLFAGLVYFRTQGLRLARKGKP
jgi:hypothetical protein